MTLFNAQLLPPFTNPTASGRLPQSSPPPGRLQDGSAALASPLTVGSPRVAISVAWGPSPRGGGRGAAGRRGRAARGAARRPLRRDPTR